MHAPPHGHQTRVAHSNHPHLHSSHQRAQSARRGATCPPSGSALRSHLPAPFRSPKKSLPRQKFTLRGNSHIFFILLRRPLLSPSRSARRSLVRVSRVPYTGISFDLLTAKNGDPSTDPPKFYCPQYDFLILNYFFAVFFCKISVTLNYLWYLSYKQFSKKLLWGFKRQKYWNKK